MYKRILIAVDGSSTSNRGLLVALQLARETKASVRLVHVADELGNLARLEFDSHLRERVREQVREQGMDILARALAIADSAEVPAETRLLESRDRRLGEVIADASREWKADLVVLGTHGRHSVQRALLGSGAEQILRESPVPVLLVPGAAGVA